ncbi:hypothetical protein GP486_002149 [Trichoglossum hirsutum]|uniref:Uncharacterized protein n=1 Tax=Trichoglossum hirsutum TaxID=265104 RepID=A0A9P8LFA7_9PEZI|nr:hypothetical protein GP486_002149 [Trichoglossum hirsutum]
MLSIATSQSSQSQRMDLALSSLALARRCVIRNCSLKKNGTKTPNVYAPRELNRDSFGAPVEHNLRSSIVHISVKEPFIYASTASDSLSILSWDGAKLVPQFRYEEIPHQRLLSWHVNSPTLSDEVARSGLYHLTLPAENITLATDKEGTVTGIWQPPSSQSLLVILFGSLADTHKVDDTRLPR